MKKGESEIQKGKNIKKLGVSPVIATILLIALVIIIGVIIFLWFSSLTEEAITKDFGSGEQNVKIICEEVDFDADYNYATGDLTIVNEGNVPIYDIEMRLESYGSYETKSLQEDYEMDETDLLQGGIFSDKVSSGGIDKIILIPVLMGLNEDGIRKTKTCDERHGEEIAV